VGGIYECNHRDYSRHRHALLPLWETNLRACTLITLIPLLADELELNRDRTGSTDSRGGGVCGIR